jgi:ABC-type nickel/cobalt efflux system permease component RcnA
VVLVYAGVLVFNWTRERMVAVTEAWLAPLSYAAIAGIGVWLAWRGLRHLMRPAHDHHHHRDHDAQCTHRHGPTPEEIAAVSTWRDAALLIGGIALRPCTGALFLLVITFSMGIPLAGVLGAYTMGLGTAAVTTGVALGAVWFRQGLAHALDGRARLAIPTLELAAGLAVMLAALELLRRAL